MMLAIWDDGQWEKWAILAAIIVGAYLAVMWGAALYWVYRDAMARSRDPLAHYLAVLSVALFNLPGLLPDRDVSVRYSGSLTTPSFTEPVSWVVLKQPIEMSAGQIDAFRELFEEGNAREPQPLNRRRVASDADRLQAGIDPE